MPEHKTEKKEIRKANLDGTLLTLPKGNGILYLQPSSVNAVDVDFAHNGTGEYYVRQLQIWTGSERTHWSWNTGDPECTVTADVLAQLQHAGLVATTLPYPEPIKAEKAS